MSLVRACVVIGLLPGVAILFFDFVCYGSLLSHGDHPIAEQVDGQAKLHTQ
jgi:hypothetical protein